MLGMIIENVVVDTFQKLYLTLCELIYTVNICFTESVFISILDGDNYVQ